MQSLTIILHRNLKIFIKKKPFALSANRYISLKQQKQINIIYIA